MAKRDYYKILELTDDDKLLNESEFKKVLKTKYRKLCKEYHPDVKPDDSTAEELFKEAAEAYDVLSNPEKKAQYDQFGHQQGPIGGGNRNGGFYDMDEILRNFTGQGRQIRKGQDLRLNIKLTLEEMFNGVNKKIKYKKFVLCEPCKGNGGHKINNCSTCRGSGRIIRQQQFGPHIIQQESTCHVCNGNGKHIEDICATCGGRGLNNVEVEVELKIPAGVSDGMSQIHEGGGHGIQNGVDGNLVIIITEKNHDIFIRSGNDLKITVTLRYAQLVLGDKIEIPTIEGGKIRVTIPKHSKVGDNLRIPSKGMNIINTTSRGDIIITLGIEIPKSVTDEEIELLNKLDALQNNVASK